jgi:regulator of replication initiation timing
MSRKSLPIENELARLSHRCRAREEALEHLSAAVIRLRRANCALSEENSLLRLEIERLQGRAVDHTSGIAV